jgi:hypothetical protein
MKAYSFGLEVDLKLSEEEARSLQNSPLMGILRFRDSHSERENPIPFRLKYSPLLKEPLCVKLNPPNCYFGDSRLVEFEINLEEYQSLMRNNLCGDRFLLSGKLIISKPKAL